jgi:osmotically-inducible protein OsmY
MIRSAGGKVIEQKAFADMSEKELNAILTFNGRVSQALVNDVYEELRRRQTNRAIEQARADQEFLEEVREALREEGKAEAVVITLTSDEAKTLAQARRLKII